MRQSGIASRSTTRSTHPPSVLSTKPRQKITWACPSDAPAWPAANPSGVRIGSRTAATRSSAGSSGGTGYEANGTILILASPAESAGEGPSLPPARVGDVDGLFEPVKNRRTLPGLPLTRHRGGLRTAGQGLSCSVYARSTREPPPGPHRGAHRGRGRPGDEQQ